MDLPIEPPQPLVQRLGGHVSTIGIRFADDDGSDALGEQAFRLR